MSVELACRNVGGVGGDADDDANGLRRWRCQESGKWQEGSSTSWTIDPFIHPSTSAVFELSVLTPFSHLSLTWWVVAWVEEKKIDELQNRNAQLFISSSNGNKNLKLVTIRPLYLTVLSNIKVTLGFWHFTYSPRIAAPLSLVLLSAASGCWVERLSYYSPTRRDLPTSPIASVVVNESESGQVLCFKLVIVASYFKSLYTHICSISHKLRSQGVLYFWAWPKSGGGESLGRHFILHGRQLKPNVSLWQQITLPLVHIVGGFFCWESPGLLILKTSLEFIHTAHAFPSSPPSAGTHFSICIRLGRRISRT